MKPRELILVKRLLLNESYNDFIVAENVLIGIDRDLLKILSRHSDSKIANEALKLRIDCMYFFASLCNTYRKVYEDLIEQTLNACQGPKPDDDSIFQLLDAEKLLPYWRTSYVRAKTFAKEATKSAEKLKARRCFQEKENINIYAIKFYFTQYLDVISYWIATRHDSESFLLLDLKDRLIYLSDLISTESTDSKYIPKKRTTEYYNAEYKGENLYEI